MSEAEMGDLDKLRALAGKATECFPTIVNFRCDGDNYHVAEMESLQTGVRVRVDGRKSFSDPDPVADFIFAVSPAAILDLIARVERAEGALSEIARLSDDHCYVRARGIAQDALPPSPGSTA